MTDIDETIVNRPQPTPVRPPHLLCSVGKNGVNRAEDVMFIRAALTEAMPTAAPVPVASERRCDADLIASIEHYQARILGMQPPFGRIDPGGTTIQALTGE